MIFGPPTQRLTLDDAQGALLAEYLFFPADELLYVRWHGHLTGAEIIRGVEHGSKWHEQLVYSLVLNDKSDTGGDWSDALPWLEYEWLPKAVAAGVRAMWTWSAMGRVLPYSPSQAPEASCDQAR